MWFNWSFIYHSLHRTISSECKIWSYPFSAGVTAMETLIPGPNPDDKRQYTVSGLIPYNNYRFRVYATNAYLEPGEMSLPTGKLPVVKYNVGFSVVCKSCSVIQYG